jgi:DnaJ-class molecular chaperone
VTIHGPVRACAYCNGTGVYLHWRLVCTGKGMVYIKEPVETCPGCKGRGLMPGQYLPCLTCHGKGVVIKKQAVNSGQWSVVSEQWSVVSDN